MTRSGWIIGAALAVLTAMAAPSPSLASGKSEKANPEPGAPAYLRLEPIIVPVIHHGAVEQHLIFMLMLEFADEAAREQAKILLPRVVDGFVRDLSILASRPGTEEGIDLTVAKRYLLATGVRVLGADAIKNVLIERTIARRVS